MSIEYKWKTSFVLNNVSSGGLISVDGMEIRSHPKSNGKRPMVSVTFRFTTSTCPTDYIQHAKGVIGRVLDSTIVSVALRGYDIREVMEEFDVELENWRELEKARMELPTKVSYDVYTTTTWNKDYIQDSLDWVKKLETQRDTEVIFRILRLLRQSILEDDEYERLSKVWRGFNAFYNNLAGATVSSETNRIRNFAKTLCSKNSSWLRSAIEGYWTPLPRPTSIKDYLTMALTTGNYSSVMDCLIQNNFIDNRGTNHSEHLATAVSSVDMMNTLENALLCVYVERNRVMHGEIISDGERDLLYICAAFLQRIVAIGLNEFYFIPIQASQPSP